jgi:methionyl-tRNA formyltransferase
MKVLVLSPYPDKLLATLSDFGDNYTVVTGPITPQVCLDGDFDFLISYGYRFILKNNVLSLFPRKAINLHISLLPFCRGAHPVFWAILERNPLGVTIHLLDEGLDTGNILFQQVTPLSLSRDESFATLYCKQRDAIELLFAQSWKYLRTGECTGWRQQGVPTEHRSKQLNDWLDLMPLQWDTSIADFCQMAGISHPLLIYP